MLDWTADVVGRIHNLGISEKEFAKECGISATYLSSVLHKKRTSNVSKKRIIDTLEHLENEAKAKASVPA